MKGGNKMNSVFTGLTIMCLVFTTIYCIKIMSYVIKIKNITHHIAETQQLALREFKNERNLEKVKRDLEHNQISEQITDLQQNINEINIKIGQVKGNNMSINDGIESIKDVSIDILNKINSRT